MPVNDAVSLVIFMSIFNGGQGLFIVRFSLNAPDLGRFLVPAPLGIGVGFAVLGWENILSQDDCRHAYGAVWTVFHHLEKHPKIAPAPFAGRYLNRFAGGALKAAAGLSGALPTMWCASMTSPKADSAVIQPFNLLIRNAFGGIDDLAEPHERRHSLVALLAIPTSIIGTWVGLLALRNLPRPIFHQTLNWLILLSGIALVLREMAGIVFQARLVKPGAGAGPDPGWSVMTRDRALI